jgi:TatD DNase family protein
MREEKEGLIDTHAHLAMDEFASDREEVLKRARDAGVEAIIVIGSDIEESQRAIELSQRYPFLYASIGIHPHEAKDVSPSTWDQLGRLAKEESVVAIGECGLDYHYQHSPRATQQETFRYQIQWAKEAHLPLIIHSREAQADLLAILKEEGAGEVGGVLHCFSGDWEMAQEAGRLGFSVSVAGTITYPKSERLQEMVIKLPPHRLLLETDCPYLAPQEYRGKRNEPAHVRLVGEKVAQLKGVTLNDVARFTTANARSVFSLSPPETGGIAYPIRHSLYLNLTNRCTNACTFCQRQEFPYVMGHNLKLDHEPSLREVSVALKDANCYEEVVFCGYGEPLLRLDLVKEVARELKGKGLKVRINTNGLGNLIHGRNILPELAGLVDVLSVSLNAEDAEKYEALCRPRWGKESYEAIKSFIREAKRYIPRVIATVVDHPAVDVARCRQIVEEELGVEFRLRAHNLVG